MLNPMKYRIVGLLSDILKALGIKGYLVGGAVRDMLLGIEPVDFDFVVECSPKEHYMLCSNIEKRLNCKVSYNNWYHTGKFQTDGFEVDIVMAREERYDGIASKPAVKAASLDKDLARRDFTINTMAVSIYDEDKSIIDPLFGIDDLKKGQIKVLHNMSFKDDPTRIFRGIKYASRFNFYFDDNTCDLVNEATRMGYMEYLKPGRVKQELIGILNEPNPIYAVGLFDKLNIFQGISHTEIMLNRYFNEEAFKLLKDNKKLSVLLCKNSDEKITVLREALNLSMDVINDVQRLKEISNILLSEDDYIYRYLIMNEKRIDWNLIRTAFYSEKRIENFLRLKGNFEVHLDKEIIKKTKEISKFIIEEKLKKFKEILKGEQLNV